MQYGEVGSGLVLDGQCRMWYGVGVSVFLGQEIKCNPFNFRIMGTVSFSAKVHSIGMR